MKTICLNMIVRDESKVIERCLSSVKNIIDYWVIVDTGSSDGTQAIIRQAMKDIPGELFERPWIDFAHNRNEALGLARGKADYTLFIDADEQLVLTKPFDKNHLSKSFYVIKSVGLDTEHFRIHLVDRHPGWKWDGVVHESVINSQEMEGGALHDAIIDFRPRDGHRFSDPNKFLKDAEVLEKALQKDPANARYVFYLAQSYFNAREFPLALKNFEKRVSMGGEKGEVYISLLCIGYVQDLLKMDDDRIIGSYLLAFQYNSSRAEPLERLGQFFYQKGWHFLGYLIAQYALSIPRTTDLSVHAFHWVYDYSLRLLFADCAFAINRFQESADAYRQVLKSDQLPAELKERVNKRLAL
ncbi:MAG: hypothetical protein HW387_956 [Parachlamydiales bacterium]|nr:hypothetical protein [Parachlamydiales bacterium]